MPLQTITSAQALAQGALAAGVKVVTSYPGSPSSETVDVLIELAGPNGLHVEWSSNEKVAMEIGIGVSIAGRRALVCTKSVGMNAMVDPLMVLNLTPVHGGLVILLGDDPGGYGSQNDQDTRPIASMVEMPMIEPATPAEGFAMMQAAFALSEQFHTPVIVPRDRVSPQQAEPVDVPQGPYSQPNLGLAREPWHFVPIPKNVVKKHRDSQMAPGRPGTLGQRRTVQSHRGDRTERNHRGRVRIPEASRYPWRRDPQDLRLLKLGVLYPLPRDLVARFLSGCREVLVLEENEPTWKPRSRRSPTMRAVARIFGKQTGHVHREGELFRWQIQHALEWFLPGFVPARVTSRRMRRQSVLRENHYAGCRFGVIVDALRDVAAGLGQNPVLIADPGCLTPVADRIDAKFAIGSAVGVAEGLTRPGVGERAVALFGDSSFFHTTLPAIVNAVHQGSDILMVVLDNGATVPRAFTRIPGVRGRPAPTAARARHRAYRPRLRRGRRAHRRPRQPRRPAPPTLPRRPDPPRTPPDRGPQSMRPSASVI